MIKSNIRKLTKTEINKALFSNFNREQRVTRCWRKAEGEWVLKDIAFTENWRDDQYEELVRYLVNTVDTGGTVWGVFKSERLIGFASLENKFFGSQSQYLQLSSIHVSSESRGEGNYFLKLIKEQQKWELGNYTYPRIHQKRQWLFIISWDAWKPRSIMKLWLLRSPMTASWSM